MSHEDPVDPANITSTQHTAAHFAINVTTPPALSAYTLAVVGLLSWVLSTYVFPKGTPGPVSAAIYTLVPAIVGYVASHISWHQSPPNTTQAGGTDNGK